MKVRKIRLQNFKRFDSFELDFTDPVSGLPRDLTVLVGLNGSGKSTVLQAVALPLAVATQRIERPDDFAWPGFLLERLNPLATSIELEIGFCNEELSTTYELSERLHNMGAFPEEIGYKAPSQSSLITLFYKHGRVECNSSSQYFQFRGRSYAKAFVSELGLGVFQKVGDVFWYDQERKATSVSQEDSKPASINALRESLARMHSFHMGLRLGERRVQTGNSDLYDELDRKYHMIFNPRKLIGVQPKPIVGFGEATQDFWFMLDDGRRYYELDEMSSGERAVFPMLFDFVKWRINRSVVLIDEIELHLHPPLQQFLIESLPKLGNDNQFIITTHSEEVVNIIPQSSVVRLEG